VKLPYKALIIVVEGLRGRL